MKKTDSAISKKSTDITGEPEDELVIRAQSHDESAIDELMNRYKGLVRKQARALFLIGGDGDDLIQEGMIALYKAINSYGNSDRMGSFSSYASTCISHHLYNVIKGANRLKNAPLNQSISLDAPVADTLEGETKTVADTLPPDPLSDPAQILIDRENVTQIEELIRAKLSPLEQTVVRLYIDGNSMQAIAHSLNRSPKSIDNALQRVKKKLTLKDTPI